MAFLALCEAEPPKDLECNNSSQFSDRYFKLPGYAAEGERRLMEYYGQDCLGDVLAAIYDELFAPIFLLSRYGEQGPLSPFEAESIGKQLLRPLENLASAASVAVELIPLDEIPGL